MTWRSFCHSQRAPGFFFPVPASLDLLAFPLYLRRRKASSTPIWLLAGAALGHAGHCLKGRHSLHQAPCWFRISEKRKFAVADTHNESGDRSAIILNAKGLLDPAHSFWKARAADSIKTLTDLLSNASSNFFTSSGCSRNNRL
jgi:hypothetical protein